ncbi:MAG: nucleotidyltransferase domain-containing protein [Oscillospiraceae bacterium]|jgi:predicted nucleotidyltransferase|nr:nucleotidyltransferase domain-containing protein [Oscillospiraceae bacterium]
MAAIPENIMAAVAQYIAALSNGIAVDKVILFGSYAKDAYHKDSDIDIAVFSRDFAEETKIDDMAYLLMKTSGLGLDIQPQAFTLEDYEAPDGFVEEILKTGVELQVA